MLKAYLWVRVLIVLAALSLSACASVTRSGPRDLSTRLDQLFGAVAPELFNGVVLIARDRDIVLHRGYGLAERSMHVPVTTETVFPIASLSKQFTAAAVLRLVADRRLDLHDTLGMLFPTAPADKRGITVHQLLTGTAGLPRDATPSGAVIERDSVVQAILATPLRRTPGSAHEYSNAGYLLLAAIVEHRAEMPFDRYLDEKLFAPAGLTSTGFPGPAWSRPVAHGYGGDYRGTVADEPAAKEGWYRRGAGGLLSTATDLFRWEQALTSGRVLPDSLVRALFTPHVAEEEGGSSFYGYGWVVEHTAAGAPIIWHNGGWGPYYAEVRRYPSTGFVAILLTNQRGTAVEEIWNTALRLVARTAPPPAQESIAEPPPN
jgi:CubicO group peptidase (beta-lactamase class C family)